MTLDSLCDKVEAAVEVTVLELSVRATSVFQREGILTIGDLVQKTEDEMLQLPNFGRRSLKETKELLLERGLHFGMKIEQPTAVQSVEKFITHAVNTLRSAEEAEAKVQAQVAAARAATKKAKDGVAKVFLDLYNALPTDARNKVRHAINTSANSNLAKGNDG